MQFDLFHSIGRVANVQPLLSDREIFLNFLQQTILAETLGFSTVWVAESHFSSEVQKCHKNPVIPYYQGEVGLNCDSPQLAHWIFSQTKSIALGTAIFNIVGGNGGPISAADRIRSLAFFNSLQKEPRKLFIGVASGRFPYINQPFGILPRDQEEEMSWPCYKKIIFCEALEIFLRLVQGETISSDEISRYKIPQPGMDKDLDYKPRWQFEPLKLVPELNSQVFRKQLFFVLGSSDPQALDVAFQFANVDIFNLSFTHPEKINATHEKMHSMCQEFGRQWHRSRMPRTVLIFIDENQRCAESRASQAIDIYIEAMRGTAEVPDKQTLLSRALIGDAKAICDQLLPTDPHGFHPDDRLMLWFEFNQSDNEKICRQMRYFADQVMPHYA